MKRFYLLFLAGPAATYFPVAWATVSWALRRLTAEFEMGSGFDRLAPITGPAKNNRQANLIQGPARQRRRPVGLAEPAVRIPNRIVSGLSFRPLPKP